MIVQVVFDLPLDGPFDYLVPEHLVPSMVAGTRVKVSFGARTQIGFVIDLLGTSAFSKLKSIQSLCDDSAVFNSLDLIFAREFCAYYGCSLGEALGTMLRNKEDHKPSIHRDHKPLFSLYRCHPGSYAAKIQEIIKGYRQSKNPVILSAAKDLKMPLDSSANNNECLVRVPSPKNDSLSGRKESHFLILVPDAFRGQTLSQQLSSQIPSLPPEGGDKEGGVIKIGMRSSVFECDGRHDCVIMVDEEDFSYKQEQMPMYDAAQVLLMRSKIYGFDIVFVGISPSVELMALALSGKIKLFEEPTASAPAVRMVDLSNYKFVPGLISPPVRDALESALKAGQKSILVLNRRGSYCLTRCVDCAEILKCTHCDSPLIYSRSEGKFLCRYCTYTAPGDTACPKCLQPSWRSQGIGVEQLQTELKKHFPQAKILALQRAAKSTVKTAKRSVKGPNSIGIARPCHGEEPKAAKPSLSDFDILISTRAVLRFQGMLEARLAAFIDFDAELNRLDMRSAFNAFSLALHVGSMAVEPVLIQTRNSGHYVLQSLSRGNIKGFYDEELKLRKEFGFSPFQHWVKISWRGKFEKSTRDHALQVYNVLRQSSFEKNCTITPPLADAVGRKCDQFRFNMMVQANQVPQAVAFIKTALAQIKRRSRVIVTMNVDP